MKVEFWMVSIQSSNTMTDMPHWLEKVRIVWDTFQALPSEKQTEKDFERWCGKSIEYLWTVQSSDARENTLTEDLRDVLFDSEQAKQVTSYLLSKQERDRMKAYIGATNKTLSTNVKLKRVAYIGVLDSSSQL